VVEDHLLEGEGGEEEGGQGLEGDLLHGSDFECDMMFQLYHVMSLLLDF
jgi:hypothetical protein